MGKEFARVRCPSCSKLVRVPRESGGHACSECGAAITLRIADATRGSVETPDDEPAEPRERRTEGISVDERGAASHELSRALGRLAILRWIFGLGALINLLQLSFGILRLADPRVAEPLAWAGVILPTLGLVVNLFALRMLNLQPVLWATVTACQSTLALAFMSLIFAAPEGRSVAGVIVFGFWLAWCAFAWWVWVAARNVRRLSREHPELYAVRRNAGAAHLRRGKAVTDEAWRERIETVAATTRRRALVGISVVCAVLVALSSLGSYSVYANLRPQSLDELGTEFIEAWNRQDQAALVEQSLVPRRAELAHRLSNLKTSRGWNAGLPELDAYEVQADGPRAIGVFTKDDLEVAVEWRLVDRRWGIHEITPPAPDFEPAMNAFRDAWVASDLVALGALFSADQRERMQSSLERSFGRREWTKSFPDLQFVDTRDLGDRRFEIRYDAGNVPFSVRWKLDEEDRWVLSSFQWPKE